MQSRKWSRAENVRFYQLLEKYGTDFLALALEFESRSKKEVLVLLRSTQNKYKKECALHRPLVEAALHRNYLNKPLAAL